MGSVRVQYGSLRSLEDDRSETSVRLQEFPLTVIRDVSHLHLDLQIGDHECAEPH